MSGRRLFAAGGAGESFSFTSQEVPRVVTAAVRTAPRDTPILAPAGYGTKAAVEFATAAERAGADGLLLFRPYLNGAGQEGLARYVTEVCRAISPGVVVYSRAKAVYSAETLARLADSCPNLIGYQDGAGGIETVTVCTPGSATASPAGVLPTAETYARPYLELGVTTYSSAVFDFVSEFALEFHDAVRERRHEIVSKLLDGFVLPFTALRDRRPGTR